MKPPPKFDYDAAMKGKTQAVDPIGDAVALLWPNQHDIPKISFIQDSGGLRLVLEQPIDVGQGKTKEKKDKDLSAKLLTMMAKMELMEKQLEKAEERIHSQGQIKKPA
jgi:hypothetical protein